LGTKPVFFKGDNIIFIRIDLEDQLVRNELRAIKDKNLADIKQFTRARMGAKTESMLI
jgi:hypothetical protein